MNAFRERDIGKPVADHDRGVLRHHFSRCCMNQSAVREIVGINDS